MKRVVLYIAASLDGYIARPDGDTNWLHDEAFAIPDEDFGYNYFLETIDTTLMGHSTYKAILGFDMPFPYPDKKNYVFSRSQEHQNTEYVEFVSNDVVSFIEQLKQQEGKDIWLIGGGEINTLAMNAGLIDEIVLTYIPIILGKGIPLFADGIKEKKLKLLNQHTYENGFQQLHFASEIG